MTNQTLMTLSTISSEANKYTIWRCYKRPTLQKTITYKRPTLQKTNTYKKTNNTKVVGTPCWSFVGVGLL